MWKNRFQLLESGARCEEKSRARDKLHDADDAFSDPLQDKKKKEEVSTKIMLKTGNAGTADYLAT